MSSIRMGGELVGTRPHDDFWNDRFWASPSFPVVTHLTLAGGLLYPPCPAGV